jgi:hypothetical protein
MHGLRHVTATIYLYGNFHLPIPDIDFVMARDPVPWRYPRRLYQFCFPPLAKCMKKS